MELVVVDVKPMNSILRSVALAANAIYVRGGLVSYEIPVRITHTYKMALLALLTTADRGGGRAE